MTLSVSQLKVASTEPLRFFLGSWAGLLASATCADGQSDENLMFMNILKQLSSLQVRVLRYSTENATKAVNHHGLISSSGSVRVETQQLDSLFGVDDLQRLDRELDHLREIGLIGSSLGGGIELSGEHTDLTPTPLALHLYVRAQGSKLPPAEFWQLQPD